MAKLYPSPRFDALFNPIFRSNRVWVEGSPVSRDAAQNNPLYRQLGLGYRELQSGPPYESQSPQTELADFVIGNSMRNDHPHGRVHRIELLPRDPANPLRAGAYDPNAGVVQLYHHPRASSNPVINPISTLIHEGTHALDRLRMRTYQDQALQYLAQQQRQHPHDFNPRGILEGAQGILPAAIGFRELYPYTQTFQPDIENAFHRLLLPHGDFSGAPRRVQELWQTRPDVHSAFYKFSEFPAFGVQHLLEPWQTADANPQSAEFMRGILTGVQRHFGNLGLTPQAHPSIMRGFQERLQQLQAAARRGPDTSIGRPAAAGPAAAAAGPQPAPAPSAAVPPAPVPTAAAPVASGIPPAPAAGPATTIGTPAGSGRV